jgi:hypothetical protein
MKLRKKCVRWVLEKAAGSSEILIKANGMKFQNRDHFRKFECTVFRLSESLVVFSNPVSTTISTVPA